MSGEQELYDLLMNKAAAPAVAPPILVREEEDETTAHIEETGLTEKGKVKDHKIPSVVTVKNLFTHPESHPVVIGLALVKKYGADWLGWEHETLDMRIPHDFGVREVSSLNMSKLQAIKTLHMVDSYWQRWEVFLACTMPFNNLLPDFEVMQVPTVAQCLVSVDIANRVRTDVPWSTEIKAYLSAVFTHDGILCPMPPIDFIKGNGDEYGVDCEEVLKRWPAVRDSGKRVEEHRMEDGQLNRMLDVYEHLRESNNALRTQLSVVDHV